MINTSETSHTSKLFSDTYDALLSELNSQEKEVVMSNFGEMAVEEVNDLSYQLENILLDSGTKKGVVKRLFSLIIEALQNIRLHGEKDEGSYQHCFFIISKDDLDFDVTCANLIFNENIPKVTERIEYINSLDKAGLKEHYMNILTDGKISSKGGAGLGFITVAMKSKNVIDYKFEKASDSQSLFLMQTKVIAKKDQ